MGQCLTFSLYHFPRGCLYPLDFPEESHFSTPCTEHQVDSHLISPNMELDSWNSVGRRGPPCCSMGEPVLWEGAQPWPFLPTALPQVCFLQLPTWVCPLFSQILQPPCLASLSTWIIWAIPVQILEKKRILFHWYQSRQSRVFLIKIVQWHKKEKGNRIHKLRRERAFWQASEFSSQTDLGSGHRPQLLETTLSSSPFQVILAGSNWTSSSFRICLESWRNVVGQSWGYTGVLIFLCFGSAHWMRTVLPYLTCLSSSYPTQNDW